LALTTAASAQGWNGFYVGIVGGGAWNAASFTDLGDLGGTGAQFTPGTTFWTPSISGATLGGQVGHNWQNGVFVYGLEADLNWASAKSSALIGGFTTATTSVDWFGTVRGRVGFVATPMLLMYLTGGLAIAHVHDTWNAFGPTLNDATRVGWTFGGGFEYMLGPNWTVRMEGLFAQFNKQDVSGPLGLVGPYRTRFEHALTIARAGFSFKW